MRSFEVHVEGYENYKFNEQIMFESTVWQDAKDYLERNWPKTVYRDARHVGDERINIYDIGNGKLVGSAWIETVY